MARTTTINGTDYRTSWNGNIQITTDHYITYETAARKTRGVQIEKGWAVYHDNGSTPKSQHGEDIEAAEQAAIAAQAATDERTTARKAEQAKKDSADAEHAALIAEKGPLATPRQVDFIMSLISQGRHHEGGFYNGPTTIEGIRKMSKSSASAYITSLTGNY